MRSRLSKAHIRGKGIEIGGLNAPLPVEPGVDVTYIDRMPIEELRKEYPTVKILADKFIVDDAERLWRIEKGSQDFVIANHVFEHCEEAIRTIKVWFRVLKPGGILYAAIPDKRYTFDKKRPITTFDHLVLDFELGIESSRRTHYEEWYALSEIEDQKNQLQKIRDALKKRQDIHFHVWDYAAIAEMFERFKDYAPIESFELHQNGHEVIVIVRKKS